MNRKMKILISYDGSEHADSALLDLRGAGLPEEAEAIVISPTDSSLPAPTGDWKRGITYTSAIYPTAAVDRAAAIAKQANEFLRKYFPTWEVGFNLAVGSTIRVIAKKAYRWNPDLIVIGSEGNSLLKGGVLNPFPQIFASASRCSIRVAGDHSRQLDPGAHNDDDEYRVLTCVDDSPESEAVIAHVASRFWPKGSEIRLFTAINPEEYSIVSLIENKIERTKERHKSLAADLAYTPAYVSSVIKEGEPADLILKEAEEWRANCIFLGRRVMNRFIHMLTENVSSRVVARAKCPVEVVTTTGPRSSLLSLIRMPGELLGHLNSK